MFNEFFDTINTIDTIERQELLLFDRVNRVNRVNRVQRSWFSLRSLRPLRSMLAMLALGAGLEAGAQTERVFQGAPPAAWIAPPGVHADSFVVFYARRALDLAERPARFLVHVSADNRYRLYVNGEQVASGPQRSDVTHWKYETVDLAPRLRAGRNVVAAIVWSWGYARPVAQHSLRAGFLVQGDGPREAALVNTGPGWKLLRDSAYRPIVLTTGFMRGYYAAAPGDSVDGRRVPWGWERPEFDDARWLVVGAPRAAGNVAPLAAFDVAAGNPVVGRLRLRGPPGCCYGEVVGWQLEPRSIPPMDETVQRLPAVRRASGVTPDERFLRGEGDLVIPARTRASILLDQRHTTNAYPVLETSGGAGGAVTLTYSEAMYDSAGRRGHRDSVSGRTIRGVRDVFLPDGGARRRFQSLYWRSWRYVQVDVRTADQPLRLHDLHGIFTAYPLRERARFASDQRWIDSVWRMNWNGVRLGAFETYMDTPYWEQLQYVGDTRVQALLSLYLSGDDRLVRTALEQFDQSRIPDGITTSRYPSALPQLIPPFALIYVAMVHDYHLHRDDPAFVRARLASVRGVLDWYAAHADSTGMLGGMPHWNYLDWSPKWPRGVAPGADSGHSAAISLLYAYALQRAAMTEADVGAPGMGAAYRARADSVVAAVRRRAWDAARGLFRDRPAGEGAASYSQQTNTLAILTGAVPGDSAARRGVMERVLADTSLTQASYYFGFYVLEALREAGLADRYVEQMAPWRGMLALGLTSAPENPEPTRSDTHAWAAHPSYGLLATVLGVRPGSGAWRTVRIAPAMGPLRRAEGVVPHPKGDIVLLFTRTEAGGHRFEVTLPEGLTGELVFGGRVVELRPGRQALSF